MPELMSASKIGFHLCLRTQYSDTIFGGPRPVQWLKEAIRHRALSLCLSSCPAVLSPPDFVLMYLSHLQLLHLPATGRQSKEKRHTCRLPLTFLPTELPAFTGVCAHGGGVFKLSIWSKLKTDSPSCITVTFTVWVFLDILLAATAPLDYCLLVLCPTPKTGHTPSCLTFL